MLCAECTYSVSALSRVATMTTTCRTPNLQSCWEDAECKTTQSSWYWDWYGTGSIIWNNTSSTLLHLELPVSSMLPHIMGTAPQLIQLREETICSTNLEDDKSHVEGEIEKKGIRRRGRDDSEGDGNMIRTHYTHERKLLPTM